MFVLRDDRYPHYIKPDSRDEVKTIIGEVAEMLDSTYWPATDVSVRQACFDLATICDRFKKHVGARIAQCQAVTTKVPLHDDGCPVPGYVGSDGEKHYSKVDIEEACKYYAFQDPDGGRVFTKDGVGAYVRELSEGQIEFEFLGVSNFASLGYGPGNEIPLYREREVWNAMRTKYRRVLTMGIVNASQKRGTIIGWES